ncbi:hypothetical protein D3C74_49280 [compost metagenome]
MGEAISPLFKKLVGGYTFGELPQKPVEYETVTTIYGNIANKDDCYIAIRQGKVLGWDKR